MQSELGNRAVRLELGIPSVNYQERSIPDTLQIISDVYRLTHIDEYYPVELTPKNQLLTVGANFSLTCTMDTPRALQKVDWWWLASF